MFLKNYTSEASVSQTIAAIERVLIASGVKGITKEYIGRNGEISALLFRMEIPGQPFATVRLAPKTDQAQQALWLDYVGDDALAPDGLSAWDSRKKKTKKDFREQAERTAWKLLRDRVEVEMSLIGLEQRDFVQAFMADVWDGQRTYYEALRENNFRALLPEKTEAA